MYYDWVGDTSTGSTCISFEVFRARHELIYRGWDITWGQYRGDIEVLQLGRRQIADADSPTKDFQISHAAVIMLTGVDCGSDHH